MADETGKKKSKTLPSWKEYKKAYSRWRIVQGAINFKLTWKEAHRKYWWTSVSKREFYYWKNMALKQRSLRTNNYRLTKWYQLRIDKNECHIKNYPWLTFLDKLPIPKK